MPQHHCVALTLTDRLSPSFSLRFSSKRMEPLMPPEGRAGGGEDGGDGGVEGRMDGWMDAQLKGGPVKDGQRMTVMEGEQSADDG